MLLPGRRTPRGPRRALRRSPLELLAPPIHQCPREGTPHDSRTRVRDEAESEVDAGAVLQVVTSFPGELPTEVDDRLRSQGLPGFVLLVAARLAVNRDERLEDGFYSEDSGAESESWAMCGDFPEQRPFEDRLFLVIMHIDFSTGAATTLSLLYFSEGFRPSNIRASTYSNRGTELVFRRPMCQAECLKMWSTRQMHV